MIKYSAIIVFPTGEESPIIISGESHNHCYEKIRQYDIICSGMIEGYLNEKYVFLDRYDAKYEAMKCNQIKFMSDSRALYDGDI